MMSRVIQLSTHYNLLTAKQKKVYTAIETFIKLNSIPPTVREIGDMIGEKTPGSVQGILNRLEKKGVIKRQIGMARSIKLISSDDELYANPVYVPEIKKITSRNIDNILNMYNIVKYQPISPDIVSSAENCFITSCPDNSVGENGINQTDMLLIQMQADLEDGNIILVLFDNYLLLRRYYATPQQGKILLKADNDFLNKEIFNEDEVIIVGKLIARFSKY